MRISWSQILAFSLFHNILQLDKFEALHLKYDNSFFEIVDQKHLTNAFFFRNLAIFLILQKLPVRQNQRC